MPYEATVPVHRRLLWPAVIDPERLLRALPNAMIDAAGNQGVAGRLRVRMREQTVTFRGIARIVEVIPASLRVVIEVEATFGRSGGAVEGLVEITLRAAGSGTRAVVGGSLHLTDDSSPLPAGEAVDAALGRIVRRWFTTLAESSPASARPDLPEASPAVPEPPRAPERAPLAVVRDVPAPDSTAVGAAAVANAEDADMEIEEKHGESAENAESADDTSGSGSEPQTIPAAADSEAAPDDESGQDEATRLEPTPLEPMVAKAATPQVQLRLVSSREDVAAEAEDAARDGAADVGTGVGADERWGHSARWGGEADRPGFPSDLDVEAEANMDTGEDIWSRLRDRGLPRWIPVIASALLAALSTTVLFILALRRHYRRHHS